MLLNLKEGGGYSRLAYEIDSFNSIKSHWSQTNLKYDASINQTNKIFILLFCYLCLFLPVQHNENKFW